MNQTKKRLSIINLAISITDIETIQLQVLKLRLLHSDEKIQEILETLQQKNYAQAQALISTYIETPNKEILQRTFQKEKEKRTINEQSVIDEFDLFSIPEEQESQEEVKTLDLDEMLKLEAEGEADDAKEGHQTVNFDSLLNINSEEILPDNIEIDISHTSPNDFWNEPEQHPEEEETLPKDTFFDDIETNEKEKTPEAYKDKDPDEHKIITEDTIMPEYHNEIPDKAETEEKKVEDTEVFKYKSIPYIDQKLKNMQVQYPSIEKSDEHFESVDSLILKIANEGYSESDIEEIIVRIDEIREDHPEEAAQLLLTAAATESKYAQFRLARTLYKGDILQKNSAESFTLINRLAINDNYPEAICDLAQFYEYGVGIDKDKKKAEALFKEAMEAGVKRAAGHFVRLQKENKSLFSFFSK